MSPHNDAKCFVFFSYTFLFALLVKQLFWANFQPLVVEARRSAADRSVVVHVSSSHARGLRAWLPRKLRRSARRCCAAAVLASSQRAYPFILPTLIPFAWEGGGSEGICRVASLAKASWLTPPAHYSNTIIMTRRHSVDRSCRTVPNF